MTHRRKQQQVTVMRIVQARQSGLRAETVELRTLFFRLLEMTLQGCSSSCSRGRPQAKFYFYVSVFPSTASLTLLLAHPPIHLFTVYPFFLSTKPFSWSFHVFHPANCKFTYQNKVQARCKKLIWVWLLICFGVCVQYMSQFECRPGCLLLSLHHIFRNT